jgi:hypothetical protein
MKKLILGSVAFTAMIAGPAMAAPRNATVVTPAYSWSDPYLGGSIGARYSEVNPDVSATVGTPPTPLPTSGNELN